MRYMTWVAALTLACIVSACGQQSRAIPWCKTPPGISAVRRLEQTPEPIRRALHDAIGDIAAPGEPFDVTDVSEVGIDRRLVFIWNKGRRWVLVTEHGGFAYNDPVFKYDLSADDQRAEAPVEVTADPATVCDIALGLINDDG
ncbi:MAG: hypothetical protein GC190_15585 [Alphaproteobacteria bacterium]|nr:hypothetical protein [Alphaproteobacteria bacterium]